MMGACVFGNDVIFWTRTAGIAPKGREMAQRCHWAEGASIALRRRRGECELWRVTARNHGLRPCTTDKNRTERLSRVYLDETTNAAVRSSWRIGE
jgi:hypothetical protein